MFATKWVLSENRNVPHFRLCPEQQFWEEGKEGSDPLHGMPLEAGFIENGCG
jgi:hypothetical protein